MKKLKLLTMITGTLLLSGCGGGGSSIGTDDFAYNIFYNMTEESCASGAEALEAAGSTHVSYEMKPNTIRCEDYGRKSTNDGFSEGCGEQPINEQGATQACVIKHKASYAK